MYNENLLPRLIISKQSIIYCALLLGSLRIYSHIGLIIQQISSSAFQCFNFEQNRTLLAHTSLKTPTLSSSLPQSCTSLKMPFLDLTPTISFIGAASIVERCFPLSMSVLLMRGTKVVGPTKALVAANTLSARQG